MIQSRPDGSVDVDALDTSRKTQHRGPTCYSPLEMSDRSVYEMAQHYYTADEIAKTFKVSLETMMKHHSVAFEAGKRDAHMKPRMLLNRLLTEYMQLESLVDMKVDRGSLLKAIEFHARKYEGYGKDEGVRISIEKPSASDIKFEPYTKDDNAS